MNSVLRAFNTDQPITLPTDTTSYLVPNGINPRLIPDQIEEAVIGSVLAYPAELRAILDIVNASHFGGLHTRPVAEAFWGVTKSNPELLASGVPRQMIEDWLIQRGQMAALPTRYLQKIEDGATHVVVQNLVELAGIVKQYALARWAQAEATNFWRDIAANPTGLALTVAEYQSKLAGMATGTGEQRRDPTVGAIRVSSQARAQEIEAASGTVGRTTGLAALDKHIKYQRRSRQYGLMGRWKGRKTSMMAFIAMLSLEQGCSVNWCTIADGTREDVYARFLAMLATGWLRKEYKGRPDLWTISAESLPYSWRLPEQQLALEWAEERIATRYGNRLRIYDAMDGIMDLETLVQTVRADCRGYGGEMLVVDYLQAIQVPKSDGDYQAMRAINQALLRLGKEHDLISWWLLQRNTSANADNADDRAGVRGGDEVIQSLDYLFRTVYDEKKSPDFIRLEMFAGRYAGAAAWTWQINKESGLILDPKAIDPAV
jgi:replicative DNA helicase